MAMAVEGARVFRMDGGIWGDLRGRGRRESEGFGFSNL